MAYAAKHANMFPTNLNTNEVKDSLGAEQEFLRHSSNGRQLVFAFKDEVPSLPHRVTVSHNEIGTGSSKRRRSMLRVDKTTSTTLSGNTRTISLYAVADIPIGDLNDYNEVNDVGANLVSLLASTGADTTIKFDCSGHGATALINGTL